MRYYNSSTGRFISEDPIGFIGKDLNLYRYTHNSPIVFNDPSGNNPYSSIFRFIFDQISKKLFKAPLDKLLKDILNLGAPVTDKQEREMLDRYWKAINEIEEPRDPRCGVVMSCEPSVDKKKKCDDGGLR